MPESTQLLRQWKLVQRLSEAREGVLLSQLATELSTSDRTIRRDLSILQSAGFPLSETRGERGIKRWSMRPLGEQLQVGYADLISVVMSRRLLEPMAGTPFWDGHQRLLRKIRGVLGERAMQYCQQLSGILRCSGFGAGDYTKRGALLDALLLGLEERRWVRVLYRGSSSAGTSTNADWQNLGPLGVIWHSNSLYLIAWSEKRGEIRNYKVDRMEQAEAAGGPSHQFTPPPEFTLDSWQASAFGVYRGTGETLHAIRIHFRPSAAQYVRESWWHVSQKMEDTPDGGVDLQLQLNELNAVAKWVLGFGSTALVLEPPELRNIIRTEAHAILKALGPEP
ncbi:MAG: helix-turn-helix transcriptional regulator [Planctomycetota bacterium]